MTNQKEVLVKAVAYAKELKNKGIDWTADGAGEHSGFSIGAHRFELYKHSSKGILLQEVGNTEWHEFI